MKTIKKYSPYIALGFILVAGIILILNEQFDFNIAWKVILPVIEFSLYMLIAMGLFSFRRVLSGRKNGCFYHKNDKPLPPLLADEIKNIHNIESPSWRVQTIAVFLMVLLAQRLGNYSWDVWHVLIQVAITGILTLGTIQAPSYHFQRGITAGLKEDWELDKIKKSEVVFKLFGKSFWKPRLFNNKGRIVAQWLGVAEIVIGTGLFIWFNLIR